MNHPTTFDPPANDDDRAVAEAEVFEKLEQALSDLNGQMAEMVRIAAARHQAGQFNEAEQLYRAIIDAQPGNAGAVHLLGVLLLQRKNAGDEEEGLILLNRAASLAPEDPDILCNLAAGLRAAGRFAESGAIYQKALYAAPGLAKALYGLGTTRVASGDLDGARMALETAAEAAPENAEIRACLDSVLGRLGGAGGEADGEAGGG